MSIKMYDLYKFEGTTEELFKFIRKLKYFYIITLSKFLKQYFRIRNSNDFYKLLKKFEESSKKDFNYRGDPFDLKASVMVYYVKGNFYLLFFGFDRGLEKIFKYRKLKWFGYWDNTDKPEEISEDEWNKRAEVANYIYSKCESVFSDGGLQFDLVNWHNLYQILDRVKDYKEAKNEKNS